MRTLVSFREEQKERSRQALIAAGVELFATEGLDGPSLDAICERAGYTRGAFYGHFADRDDFLVAVMEHVGRPLLDKLLYSDKGADLEDTMRLFISMFVDGSYPLGPAGAIRPHQFLLACSRSKKVGDLYISLVREAVDRLEVIIKRSPQIRQDVEANEMAWTMLSVIVGVQTLLDLGAPMNIITVGQTMRQFVSSE